MAYGERIDYDLAGDEGANIAFYPLSNIDSPQERLWAEDWLEVLINLQGVTLTPHKRTLLHRAVKLLAESPSKTLTDLDVQDAEIRAALSHYTLSGGFPLLDADHDSLLDGKFQVFELEHLLSLGEKNVIPILLYLFHRIDKRLDGSPTLIVLEEAWALLLNSTFSVKIEEWLRTLRKKNAAVIFVTQSLAEISRSKQSDLIIESCPTKVFLPNPEASNPHNSELYKMLGLTDKQIEILSDAVPKRHYYYSSPLGKRLFDLNLGSIALSFLGAGSREDIAEVKSLIQELPDSWQEEWLKSRGLTKAQTRLKELTDENQNYSDIISMLSNSRSRGSADGRL